MIRHFVRALLCVALGATAAHAAPASVLAKIEPALHSAVQRDGSAEFVIVLADKADLSAANKAKTKAERGQITVAALKAAASRSQGPLNALLDARGLAHQNFWVANAITTQGGMEDLLVLAARGDIAGLYQVRSTINVASPYILRAKQVTEQATAKAEAENYVAKALGDPEPGLVLIHAPEVWAMGFTGQGVVVGDHDIGVQWDHPALKKKYRGWDEATQTADHDYNWLNAFGATDLFCDDPAVPCDPNQHGTHTTGTMVGDDGAGNRIGVSPDSQWMACRSLLDPFVGLGTVPTYMSCMEWMLAPYPTGDSASADPTKAPDVVNNSWGCVEACAPPILEDVNEATLAAGIMQVVSAGNDGTGDESGCSTILFPLSTYESSFTVGANDFEDDMASFTSLGPVISDLSMRVKPNVTGPGVQVRSSVPDNDYGSLSGTSMSGPHVAGMAALVMSSEPRLIGRVADMRSLIERTAVAEVKTSNTASTCGGTPSTEIPNNIFGYGRVDALAAVLARPTLTIAVTAPASAAVGESFTATVVAAQPDTGVIDVTGALINVTLPDATTVVSADPASYTELVNDNVDGSTHTLQFVADTLAPGDSMSIRLVLSASAAGEVLIATAGEADQVSPLDGDTASTKVGAGTPDNPPVTPPTGGGSGRFGGGTLGAGLLLMLGIGVALRRRNRH